MLTFITYPLCSNNTTLLEHVLDYYPFGKTLREYVHVRERFQTTYHERDEESGLDYRGARFYDGDVGRFLSVDPLAADYAAWSPYNYVLGNPIRFIDPDGRSVEGDIYNLNGVHIGNDGIDDQRVYLLQTENNAQLSQQQSLSMTSFLSGVNSGGICATVCFDGGPEFSEVSITNNELNLRASLSVLKQAEAGRANPALDYNSWNNGVNFTDDQYSANPGAYASHPGLNEATGSSAAGAYQFLERFYTGTDFSPQSQDRAAVANMTTGSYRAALSGDMGTFKSTTKGRWTSLEHWSSSGLQERFNQYRANELLGRSNVATPVGSLLRND